MVAWLVALGYFMYDKFVLSHGRDAALIEAAPQAANEKATADHAVVEQSVASKNSRLRFCHCRHYSLVRTSGQARQPGQSVKGFVLAHAAGFGCSRRWAWASAHNLQNPAFVVE